MTQEIEHPVTCLSEIWVCFVKCLSRLLIIIPLHYHSFFLWFFRSPLYNPDITANIFYHSWVPFFAFLILYFDEQKFLVVMCYISHFFPLCWLHFVPCLKKFVEISYVIKRYLLFYLRSLSYVFFKSLLNLLQYCFCFMFWFFGCKACRILALWPGIKPTPPGLKGKS